MDERANDPHTPHGAHVEHIARVDGHDDAGATRAARDDAPDASIARDDVTQLLSAWSAGDRAALDALLPAVYAELRRQADRVLRHQASGHTLQPTALVHEAWLRLVAQRPAQLEGRAHFVAVAARCMRQVLVDAARARNADKRGGGVHAVTLDPQADLPAGTGETGLDILALDEALARLATIDPQQARLVELRYFVGLTLDETAAALGVSAATVSREWAVARRWLRRELER
ncbi:MAG: sigma-70 family RNA polymerase sigma factor [Gemmatimonadaceae bacterium]|nr:sigma-70 family RNA polymerase sigma factor [Gemmatimonadaceae bacterium]